VLDHTRDRLRSSAVVLLDKLADSSAQAILIGERLIAEQERALGQDHPNTLTSRNKLAAHRAAPAVPKQGT